MKLQRGVTLLEVLAALLVLKLGLLSALSAQLLAFNIVTDAMQRTTAISLAQDISQQLKAFDLSTLAKDFSNHAQQPVNDCSAAMPCAYEDARHYLLWRWQQKWQIATTGYGYLLAAEFCLRQQAGRLELNASWRHKAAATTVQTDACEVADGRSGFHLY